MSVIYVRPVRFEEVDAAGIVFFARFFNYCHEAMEHFFDPIDGQYVGLIMKRQIGFPAVHVTADWKSPLRYGDVARIETSTKNIGASSATFRYVLTRSVPAVPSAADHLHVATIEHVVVATNLKTMTKLPLPEDCRALLMAHTA